MSTYRKLTALIVAAALSVLAACGAPRSQDTGVVEVRDVLLTHVSADYATEEVRKKLGTEAATVSPNYKNNSLIVIGSAEQLEKALEAIREVDQAKN